MTYRATEDALRAECSALRQELKAFEHLAAAAALLGDRVRARHRAAFLFVGLFAGVCAGACGASAYARVQRPRSTLAPDHGGVFGDDVVREALVFTVPFAGDVSILGGEHDAQGLTLRLAGRPEGAAVHIARSHPLVSVADLRQPVTDGVTTLSLRFIDGASPRVRVTADYGVLRVMVSRAP